MEFASTKIVECTKAHGKQIKGTVRVTKSSVMGTNIWAIMSTDESAVKACIPGRSAIPLMVNGLTESNTDMVSGKVLLETVTSASGFKTKRMAMVFTNGRTETGMKENGNIVCDMGKGVTHLQMEMFTLVSITTAKPTDMDNTNGKTATSTLAYSVKA